MTPPAARSRATSCASSSCCSPTRSRKSSVVLTCGGIQSNHARATAIACAQLGLGCVLFLRVRQGPTDPAAAAPRDGLARTGNVLLDRLVGAQIRLITPADYSRRAEVMRDAAESLERAGEQPYVIPEGGSNGLGALGYVDAMREVRSQLDQGLGGGRAAFDVIVHACGSGGTAAGIALGAARFNVAPRVRAVAVCDDRAYFDVVIARIVAEAQALEPDVGRPAELVVDDASKGPGYGVMSPEQRAFLVEVARAASSSIRPTPARRSSGSPRRSSAVRSPKGRGSCSSTPAACLVCSPRATTSRPSSEPTDGEARRSGAALTGYLLADRRHGFADL